MAAILVNAWLGITIIFNFLLGFLTYHNNPNSRANIFYSLAVSSAAVWTLGTLIFRLAEGKFLYNASTVLWAATVPIVYFFLYFSINFPSKTRLNKITHFVILIPTLYVLVFLIIYKGLFIEISYLNGFRAFIFNKNVFIQYGIYISLYFACAFLILSKKYSENRGNVKTQISLVLIGTFISSVAGVVFGLFFTYFGYFKYYWLSSGLTIIMTSFLAYAIIRHRLMDIKLVLRQYSVYIVSLLSLLLPALTVKVLMINYFSYYDGWIDLATLIIAIALFPGLKKRYYRLANKYFFSSLYDDREVIAELTDKLSTTLEVKRIYEYITDILLNSFHAKTIGILTFNKNTNRYRLQHSKGYEVVKKKHFNTDAALFNDFIKENKAIIVDEIKEQAYEKHKETVDMLGDYGVEVIIPLNLKNKNIGIIVFGPKESGDIYNDHDIQVLKIIGSQAVIAVDNALHYEEIKNFSIKLKKEVDIATEDLRSANDKLRQLDEAKSEFISIASHQLRTPLTVIKGYISMILDGNFGKLTDNEVEALEKVYASNERLIQLVENLLNISRIESGRLQFNFKAVKFISLVASVVEELGSTARAKGIKLIFEKPKIVSMLATIDEEKIRQVIMNLIDNAIKYTKQGQVVVELEKTENKIKFSVTDTGLGILKEEMEELFNKFARGAETSLVYTEGTGLGLYVAKQMIDAHKGKIWAESSGLNKGSKFCFEIPI